MISRLPDFRARFSAGAPHRSSTLREDRPEEVRKDSITSSIPICSAVRISDWQGRFSIFGNGIFPGTVL